MQPNVPPEPDQRTAKTYADLKAGDWLANGSEYFDFVDTVVEVLHVTPYTDVVDNDRVLLVLRVPGDSSPQTVRCSAVDKVELATDDEVRGVRTSMRWNAVADALVRVADSLRTIRVGDPGVSIDIFPAGLNASSSEAIAAVDAICQAVFGKQAATRENTSDHRSYRQGRGDIGSLHVSVAALLDGRDGGCE